MGKRRVLFASAAVVVGAIGAGGIATAHGPRDHFHVTLRGSNEVPPADPDGKATARLDIDLQTGEVCWELRFDRIADPTMAHIHNAAKGVNGQVVVLFFDPTHPFKSDVDDFERGRVSGCSTPSNPNGMTPQETAADIAAHPQNYYVNIHDARFPTGAVRGQLP